MHNDSANTIIGVADNNTDEKTPITPEQHDALLPIAGQSLAELNKHNKILIFPQNFEKSDGDIGKQTVFEIKKSEKGEFYLSTGNIMGFIGINGVQVRIHSRFAKDDAHDYFLHYMLFHAFSMNMLDLKYSSESTGVFNLLYCAFIHQLKAAYRQGIYKTYVRNPYNDTHLRGSIDIARHIKHNQPFCGDIAYTLRERSASNPLMMLVRHAIEIIRSKPFGKALLTRDKEIQSAATIVVQATPDYHRGERMHVLRSNARDIQHPYYTEYSLLQRIARMIVSGQAQNYGASKDQAYGVLFDGAWLWEQYLATVLEPLGFIHSDNITGRNPIYLFQSHKYKRYPDYYAKDFSIILDAKYKKLDDADPGREDMHQIIAYMYITKAKQAGFIYPSLKDSRDDLYKFIGELNGYGGNIYKYGVCIPGNATDMNDFCAKMHDVEQALNELCSCKNANSIIIGLTVAPLQGAAF
jgi:5-methylcytosine-specific restriction endonuclease McrBC regulatory subunit McrC